MYTYRKREEFLSIEGWAEWLEKELEIQKNKANYWFNRYKDAEERLEQYEQARQNERR